MDDEWMTNYDFMFFKGVSDLWEVCDWDILGLSPFWTRHDIAKLRKENEEFCEQLV